MNARKSALAGGNGGQPIAWKRLTLVSLAIWGVYGVCETFFTSYLPLVTRKYLIFKDNPLILFGLLFLVYPLLGFAQANVLHFALRKKTLGPNALWSVSILFFTFVFAAHAASRGFFMVLPGSFFVALLVLFQWNRREAALSPWLAIFYLVSLAHLWGSRPQWAWPVRLILITAFMACGLLLVWMAGKIRGKWRLWDGFFLSPSPLIVYPLLSCLFLGLFVLLFKTPKLKRFEGIAAASSGQPPVVLIVWDTARMDHLSLYGYPRRTTPNLERFFREGATLYRRHFAVSNYTLPTHASIFTGVETYRHRVVSSIQRPQGIPFADRFVTLPVLLAEKGYRNIAFVANMAYVSGELDFSKGFLFYENRSKSSFIFMRREYFLREGLRRCVIPEPGTKGLLVYQTAEKLTDQSLAVLDRVRSGDSPFFIFYNFMDVHSPCLPPPPFNALFGDPASGRHLKGKPSALSVEQRAQLQRYRTAQYDGGLAYLDHHFGRLMDELKKRGLFEKALIILTSDHGEFLGEGGRYGHAITLENEIIHVPLVIKYPGQREPAIVEENCSQVDILPTVVDVLGLSPLEGLSGKSLRSKAPEPLRIVMSESYTWQEHPEARPQWRALASELALMTLRRKRVYAFEGFGLSPYGEKEEPFRGVLKEYLWQRQRKRRPGPVLTEREKKKAMEKLKTLGYF
ncbi:MAG: sulfatase-like hydrolase/transferase [Candidatus Aminicenantes bacterium]|nr:sulfatase-like hydrolase/transferase [Candidatus Aminicenantes bacterium]